MGVDEVEVVARHEEIGEIPAHETETMARKGGTATHMEASSRSSHSRKRSVAPLEKVLLRKVSLAAL
jgi:hypothetical protein